MIRTFIYTFCLERDRKNTRERERKRKSVTEKENEREKERDSFLKTVMTLSIMKF